MWGFEGTLVLSGLENLESLGNSEWAKKVPEARLVLPFLSNLDSLNFSGSLPTDYRSPTAWSLTFHLADGSEYPLQIEVDPGATPWKLDLDLSPIDFDLSLLAAFIPTPWGIPRMEGKTHLEKAHLSGPIGDWSRWEAKAQVSANIPSVELSIIDRTLSGLNLHLDFVATQELWKGTAKAEIDQVGTDVVEGGLRGFQSTGLDFTYSMKDGSTEIDGPWSAKDIWGSAYSGTLALSSITGYRVEAETDRLNWKDLPYHLDGNWRAKIELEDSSLSDFHPDFQVTLAGTEFRVGEMDFSSRPVTLGFGGKVTREQGQLRFDQVTLRWGDSLTLDMAQTQWTDSGLLAQEASLSGDLLVLSELMPGFVLDPRIERYIHPKDWRVSGGIRIQTTPDFTLEIQQGQIDSGKGIKGPIGFSYSQKDRSWAFQAPTLDLNLSELAKEVKIPGIEIKGSMVVRADFAGQIPQSGETPSLTLSRAFFDAEVRDCDGRFGRWRPDGELDQHLFGWMGAAGSLSLDWNSTSKRIQSNLQMKDFIWYSRPGNTERPYPHSQQSGGARLSLNVEQKGENLYDIKKIIMAWGRENPMELGLTGSVERKGEIWSPDLSLRIQGNRSPKTAVFRCVNLAGSGILQGTIGANNRGNWILNGKATLDDFRFEHIVAPVILEGLKGTFQIIDFPLDEYMFESRWKMREHREIKEVTELDIVDRAFRESEGTSPNLLVSQMTVGKNVFNRVALRVVREGEFLFMNTASGEFAEGGFPLRMTGYFFFHPRDGVAYRVAGYTQRAPLGMAIPLLGSIGLDYQAVEVRFFIAQDLFQEEVQTRYINLGIPIDMLKKFPAIGPSLFGWTPDLLQSKEIIVRKVGDGEWTVLNPVTLGDAVRIPEYILRDIPIQSLEKGRDMGVNFLDGFGDGVREILEGPNQ